MVVVVVVAAGSCSKTALRERTALLARSAGGSDGDGDGAGAPVEDCVVVAVAAS